MLTFPDGSKLYDYRDTQVTDVLLNGQSVLHLGVMQVKVNPQGNGYVWTIYGFEPDQKDIKRYIDESYRAFVFTGDVQVVEE